MKNPRLSNEVEQPLKKAFLTLDFFEQLLENVACLVCAFDKDGNCQYVNQASRQLLGYAPAELVGVNFLNFLVEEDIARTMAFLAQTVDLLPTYNFTNRVYKKDGSVVSLHWSGNWVAAEGLHYCIAKDDTYIKSIENKLEQTQKLASVGCYEFDFINKVYTYASDTLFDIFGIDRKKHPVFNLELFWNAIHPDDLAYVKENLLLPEHMYQPELEYRIVQPSGKLVYIKRLREIIRNEEGNPVKTVGILQDITDRKKTELALRQSGERLKALVENSSDLISIVDLTGKYTYVAESVKQILGFEADSLLGKNAFDFIHPDDQPLAAQALSEIGTRKFVIIKPFRFLDAEGNWHWIESKVANFADDPAINGLIINSRDITEQKSRQDKIRELSIIAEKTNQAILLSDDEHRMTWINKAFTDLSEYHLNDIIGLKPEEIFCNGEEAKDLFLHMKQELDSRKTVIKEVLCYSKTGRQYWMELQVQPVFNDEGTFIQHLAIGKDITERKRIDAQLALSEQKFKALVQNSSDLIVILDENGCFKYVSENVAELLNYNAESLKGKSAFELIHKDEREHVWNELQKLLTNTKETKGVQHRFLKADGTWIWLESKGANHLDNKSVAGILINARDIDDRVKLQKKLDNELRNRQKELTTAVINAQELERSQLGLELHDNVNQVLTTVKLYNEMFLSGISQDKELIQKSTVYLQDCINEIRSISKRLSAPTLGHISLHDSIQELIESIILTRRIEILFRPYGIVKLCISRELHLTIYRIVQEGLNNVIKYAEATTAIIAIRHWENTLNVTIYDDGKGFDTKVKRSGIGIANMRSRAENMGGKFEINSTPGSGCAIKIVFPLTV